jgi:hypothetical protein
MIKYILFLVVCLVPSTLPAQSPWKKLLDHPTADDACVEVNPLSQGRILYAAVSDTFHTHPLRIARSDDAGETWKFYDVVNGFYHRIHQIFCLPIDTSIVFAVGDSLFRSSDGGVTWTSVVPVGAEDGQQLAYHAPRKYLYYTAGDSLNLWHSTDRGATWRRSTTVRNNDVCTFVITIGGVFLIGEEWSTIERSTNGGNAWQTTTLLEDLQTPSITPEVAAMVSPPGLPHTALATIFASPFHSVEITTDDGANWMNVASYSQYAWAIEVDPDPARVIGNIPQHFWVGLIHQREINEHVGETWDGGRTWTFTSLPDSSEGVWVLKYVPETRTLLAASNEGLYAMQSQQSVVLSEAAHAEPFTVRATLRAAHRTLAVSASSVMREITLFDILGRSVALSTDLHSNAASITLPALVKGPYVLKARSENGQIASAKVFIE